MFVDEPVILDYESYEKYEKDKTSSSIIEKDLLNIKFEWKVTINTSDGVRDYMLIATDIKEIISMIDVLCDMEKKKNDIKLSYLNVIKIENIGKVFVI